MNKTRRIASESVKSDELSKNGPPNIIDCFKTNSVGALDALEKESEYEKMGVKAKLRMDETKRREKSIRFSLANIASKTQEIGLPKIVTSEDGEKLKDALAEVEYILDTIERKEILEAKRADSLLKIEEDEEDMEEELDEIKNEEKEEKKIKISQVWSMRCDVEEELDEMDGEDEVFDEVVEENFFIFPTPRGKGSSGYGSAARASTPKIGQVVAEAAEAKESEPKVGVARRRIFTEESDQFEDAEEDVTLSSGPAAITISDSELEEMELMEV